MEIKKGVSKPREMAITDADFLSITYRGCFDDELATLFSGNGELPKLTWESATRATQATISAIPTRNFTFSFSLKSK